jgi:hypothetical protein
MILVRRKEGTYQLAAVAVQPQRDEEAAIWWFFSCVGIDVLIDVVAAAAAAAAVLLLAWRSFEHARPVVRRDVVRIVHVEHAAPVHPQPRRGRPVPDDDVTMMWQDNRWVKQMRRREREKYGNNKDDSLLAWTAHQDTVQCSRRAHRVRATNRSMRYRTSSSTVSAVLPWYGSMCTPQCMPPPARSTAATTAPIVWSVCTPCVSLVPSRDACPHQLRMTVPTPALRSSRMWSSSVAASCVEYVPRAGKNGEWISPAETSWRCPCGKRALVAGAQ